MIDSMVDEEELEIIFKCLNLAEEKATDDCYDSICLLTEAITRLIEIMKRNEYKEFIK